MNDLVTTTAAELAPETAAAEQFITACDALPVASQDDLSRAGALLVGIKTRWKELEARRTNITRPMLEAKRRVDDLFSPVLAPLKRCEEIIKAKIATYELSQERERLAALPEVANGAPVEALAPTEMPKGVSFGSCWEPEVVDAEAVPRQYCSPDANKLRYAAWYADTERTPPLAIPGVKWVLKGSVRVRTVAP